MSSQPPLTEAEQAAAEVIRTEIYGGTSEEVTAWARAVVAAVRGSIEADALEDAAAMVENIPSVFIQRASVVDRLRKRAARRRQSLSRPTSEERL